MNESRYIAMHGKIYLRSLPDGKFYHIGMSSPDSGLTVESNKLSIPDTESGQGEAAVRIKITAVIGTLNLLSWVSNNIMLGLYGTTKTWNPSNIIKEEVELAPGTFVPLARMVTDESGVILTSDDFVAGTLTTGSGLTAIDWNAKFGYTDVQVALIDPSGNNQPLSIAVANHDISVSLATDGGGLITSTPVDIVNAITAHAVASTIVIAEGTGTSAVIAVVLTALTGDAGLYYMENSDFIVIPSGLEILSDSPNITTDVSGLASYAYTKQYVVDGLEQVPNPVEIRVLQENDMSSGNSSEIIVWNSILGPMNEAKFFSEEPQPFEITFSAAKITDKQKREATIDGVIEQTYFSDFVSIRTQCPTAGSGTQDLSGTCT